MVSHDDVLELLVFIQQAPSQCQDDLANIIKGIPELNQILVAARSNQVIYILIW
jgi:hypothetical protein